MRHPNVIATAIGLYRIRVNDSWPTEKGPGKIHGRYPRTLENSEVRPYSWPAILVFVKQWQAPSELAPAGLVPKTLYLPDGRSVPVCVIEAPREETNPAHSSEILHPVNNIGGGWPVIAESQGRRYAATIACLVSDGHTVYALTNRHVAGEEGEIVYSRLGGKQERIGTSSAKNLTRALFTSHYPGWPGRDVYVNLDVGLIEIDDLDQWTAEVRNIGQMGKMVDLSVYSISLALIGSHVRGTGAASGEMQGEIAALFYRYKTNGGFEYVADVLIGPRSAKATSAKATSAASGKPPFATHPGDSGTLWLLEPMDADADGGTTGEDQETPEYLPLAMQWGRNMLYSAGGAPPQSYALATFLSRVCAELGVDPVRNWNLGQPDTWMPSAISRLRRGPRFALSSRLPKLVKLMANNAHIISYDDAAIIEGDFTGMGTADFVALADVPDFYWKMKIAKQGFARSSESPNHFADMDQPDDDGNTLLDLCKDDEFIDPGKWDAFYDFIVDVASGKRSSRTIAGSCRFGSGRSSMPWRTTPPPARRAIRLRRRHAHPLYRRRLPALAYILPARRRPRADGRAHDHQGQEQRQDGERRFAQGVHTGYEDAMISAFREEVLDGLKLSPRTRKDEMISNGFEAAKLTIAMMRRTFTTIPPIAIVNAFGNFEGKPKARAEHLWKKFGRKTIRNMQSGAHLLAVLWESAWMAGNGEHKVTSTRALKKDEAMDICAAPDFVPSVTIGEIGPLLKLPT